MLVQTASAACYTPSQFRAEQAMRYHTRLMVVWVCCARALTNKMPMQTTRAFTKRNQNIMREQENILIAYFKQIKKPNARARAAQLPYRSGQQNLDSGQHVCRAFVPNMRRIMASAKTMQPAQFKAWIVALDAQKPQETSTPVCATQKNVKK
jgi:hypothetical protein